MDTVSIALEELLLCADDSRNLEKIEPVLSLIVFMFYNENIFGNCVREGLFNKLI